jgi:hypothetical protein
MASAPRLAKPICSISVQTSWSAPRAGVRQPPRFRATRNIAKMPAGAVLITPGVRRRAVGRMPIFNVVVPPFDPADEWFDLGRDVSCSVYPGTSTRPRDRHEGRGGEQSALNMHRDESLGRTCASDQGMLLLPLPPTTTFRWYYHHSSLSFAVVRCRLRALATDVSSV